jgi:hypothetical protein
MPHERPSASALVDARISGGDPGPRNGGSEHDSSDTHSSEQLALAIRDALVEQLRNQAWWRERKAEQWPDDHRNLRSARAPQEAADWLQYLRDEDTLAACSGRSSKPAACWKRAATHPSTKPPSAAARPPAGSTSTTSTTT